ncbi:MAG: hypothetical protein HMLKMBBP_01959 [Planctomycetes bacterium]|nr:hypothetical protein [Planctomycetota bacterium]
MRIHDIMTKDVSTIAPDRPAEEARTLMRSRRIRHLVVRGAGGVVGVVSERDLGGPRGRAPSGTVGEVMSPRVVTIAADATLRDAAKLLRGHGVGCLPVTAPGDRPSREPARLVGIVTVSDMLDALLRGTAPGARDRATPYLVRRQGPPKKPRGERLRRR